MNLHRTYFLLPKEVLSTLDAVRLCARKQGVRVYLVGGIVRDMVTGRKNFDLDVTVEGDAHALADAVATVLGVSCRKYAAFGTATVDCLPYPVDLAMCREETYEKPGALPTVTRSTLDKDLKRRDFTINAMAMSLNDDDFGTVIDPYEGLKDIKQKLIRVLHRKSFVDDPTRIFRSVRFKERFAFVYERRTNRLIKEALLEGCFRSISPQRVCKELAIVAQEERVCECVRSLYRLTGNAFLLGVACREKPDLALMARVFALARHEDDSLSWGWLLYAVLYFYASPQEKEIMSNASGFTRTQRQAFVRLSPQAISRLDRSGDTQEADKYLEGVHREGIIFVCAGLRNARLREYLLSKRLQTKG